MNAAADRLDVRGRRIGGRILGGGKRRTHCHRGHDLASAYLCRRDDGGLYRRCRDCDLERAKRRKETSHV